MQNIVRRHAEGTHSRMLWLLIVVLGCALVLVASRL
jgi:hypothetical protein